MQAEMSKIEPPVEGQYRHDVRGWLASSKSAFIGGESKPATGSAIRSVIDPATNRTIATVTDCTASDVDTAVASARATFEAPEWSHLPPNHRARLLWRLADLIEANLDHFAQLESLDVGKPIANARSIDIPNVVETFRYFAGWCTKIEGKTFPVYWPEPTHAFTRREPIGVVGMIAPWNFPLVLMCWKIAPALAAGCTCVVKPSELTPLTTLRLAELAIEAGFPPGALNVVTGKGTEVGRAMTSHPGIDKIAFTGGTTTGKQIATEAVHSNLKRVSLELGGKSPTIITSKADLEAACMGAGLGFCANSGQFCLAGTRLIVESGVYDQVLEGIVGFANAIKIGSPLDEDTQMGPMISDDHRSKVHRYVKGARDDGSSILSGGEHIDKDGFYFEPTVIVDVKQSQRIVQEEVFGPVVTVQRAQDLCEAIELANDSSYGLGAYVWSQDLSEAHTISTAVRSGMVFVNCFGAIDPAMPFGGVGQSGWGRENGFDGLSSFMETKSVVMQV